MKICFLGAGSTIFAKNVLGDCMLTDALCESEIALYDIDRQRLQESFEMLQVINKNQNNEKAIIKKYLGVKNRKKALKGSNFVVSAIQVGGYDPCTITDFSIPKKYGLRQTIGDTLGIGGIFRALRTIPVFKEFANDIAEVCPDAWLLNYVNPLAMITGYIHRHTNIKAVGLCHSVEGCPLEILKNVGLEPNGYSALVAGINHMGWLLEINDKDGNDLYPEIRKRAIAKNASEKHNDMVRFEYIKHLGYYCTESSEHNAEYNNFFIKKIYPELIDKFNIPLDDYPSRCVRQIDDWSRLKDAIKEKPHIRSYEYASYIMEAMVTDKPYKIGGNVINNGLIDNLPRNACVEVPCLVKGEGIFPCHVGSLPEQLAAMNRTNINVQLLTIEAAYTLKKEHIYHAAMLDPHTSSELSIDDIVSLCNDLIEAHGNYLPKYI